MTKCRYCCSSIDERARICPECQRSQTFGGLLTTAMVTGFPMLAAFISFGFAIYEKVQANIAWKSLDTTETRLEVEQIRTEAAEEAVVELAQQLQPKPKQFPAAALDLPTAEDHSSAEPAKSAEQQLEDIRHQQSQFVESKQFSKDQIVRLQKDRIRVLVEQAQNPRRKPQR